MEEKKCTCCGKSKSFSDFCKKADGKNGLSAICKLCKNSASRFKYQGHTETQRESRRKRYAVNADKIKYTKKLWRIAHPDKVKEATKRRTMKIYNAAKGKLNTIISSGIRQSIYRKRSGYRWEGLVGYTIDELRRHLEKQFTEEMTWDNYGKFWEIDHKIPKSAFNFDKSGDIDFQRCWEIENLQPLEKNKNHSKGSRLYIPFQPSLLISSLQVITGSEPV